MPPYPAPVVEFPMSGSWWFSRAPRRKVAGTLNQDADGRLALETIGGLEEEPSSGAERIYGKCLEGSVTLVDAEWKGSRGAYSDARRDKPDSVTELWEATLGLVGRHVPERQTFAGVSIESYWTDGWADIPYWEQGRYSDGVLLRLAGERYAEIQRADFDGGSVDVSVGMTQQTGARTWSIARHTRLNVRRNHPLSLASCLADVGHLDALTNVLFGRPTSAANINVTTTGGPGRQFGHQRALIGTVAPPRFASPGIRIHGQTDSLCTFDQFGGIHGIAQWYALREEFRYLAGRIGSHHRASGRFLEDRALVAFSAGEALDRQETGYSQSNARTRWKRLANAIPEFGGDYLNVPVDTWANALVESRDDLSHALTLGPRSLGTRGQLDGVTASAHFLCMLTLFRLAGLGARVSPMVANQRWRDEKLAFAYLTNGFA